MKILVTGGAGFIGSHVVDQFVNLGHGVVVVDNMSTGSAKFVNPKAELIEADITDHETITEIIQTERPDVIDHHAAHIQVGNSVKNPQFDAVHNIIGTLNIMQAAKDVGVKKVIMASTGGAMYGDKPVPFDESMREEPLSPYGISKRSAEHYLNFYYVQYGIPYIALRYANVYGPRQNPHGESGVIAIFAEMMMQGKKPIINGDGNNSRDYVFVADVAKANELALNSNYVGALNIGTSTETTTNEVYDKVAQELEYSQPREHGPARPGEQVRSVLSYQKANTVLGWQPTVTFDQGVKLVAEWYKNGA